MNKITLSLLFSGLVGLFACWASPAEAQNAILAELYGRAVHAHYAGQYQLAYQNLSTAISNGSEDPRVFYFRGIVAEASGRPYEAEQDWRRGAELEAQGKIVGSIGRALQRYQGHSRLKLEQIRQSAKLQYLAQAAARSQQRLSEVKDVQGDVLKRQPNKPIALAPPPVAEVSSDNPFGDSAVGPARVDNADALGGALSDPFAGEAPAAGNGNTAPAGGGGADPFGGSGGGTADPFGGSGGGNSDPFGGGASGDPFGDSGGGDDPFSNPFGG